MIDCLAYHGENPQKIGASAGICAMCDGMESIDHVLFLCPMASFIWTWIRESVDWTAKL
jgi:hypothetical protein